MNCRYLRSLVIAGSAACLATVAAPASAASITFAQFTQLNPTAKIFAYDDTGLVPPGAVATLTSVPSSTVFVSALGSLLSPSLAKVTVNASAAALATPGPGTLVSQLFSGTIDFELLAPQMGLSGPSTHALTVTFTNALFGGPDKTEAPTLTADDHLGSAISYDSDFLDLSQLSRKNFSLSFSSTSTPMEYNAGHLPDFVMSGTGTFAGAVPEPATWAFSVTGFGLLGKTMRRKRAQLAAA